MHEKFLGYLKNVYNLGDAYLHGGGAGDKAEDLTLLKPLSSAVYAMGERIWFDDIETFGEIGDREALALVKAIELLTPIKQALEDCESPGPQISHSGYLAVRQAFAAFKIAALPYLVGHAST